jgi:hypothetical protein
MWGTGDVVGWKPLHPGQEYYLVIIQCRGIEIYEHLWIQGREFLAIVELRNPDGTVYRKRLHKTRNYKPAADPCGREPQSAPTLSLAN